MSLNLRAEPRNFEAGDKPLAVSVKTMCRLLEIGNTKAWELIASGRVRTFNLGRKRLIVFASLEELIAEADAR